MVKHPTGKLKIEPALARYPGPMAGLLSLSETADDAAYLEWAERLRENAAELVRMALDEDLNDRESEDPAGWAPIHALRILALLGPEGAAEPLLAAMDWDSDWFEEELPPVFGAIGAAAVSGLETYIADPSHNHMGRARAAASLKAIAEAHPQTRGAAIDTLTALLGRQDADTGSGEEYLTANIIGDLADLQATTAYEAIRSAFAEDRVDTQIIGLEDVERDFGMLPPLDFDAPPPPKKPGVRLSLKCKACGRERDHIFPRVYFDLGTYRDKEKSAKYNPLVIPQHVVCPKCGAVDQYELSGLTYLSLIASMIGAAGRTSMGTSQFGQDIEFTTFTSRWGPLHPLESVERYRTELARRPDDVSLHIGLGNQLRFLGRYGEADTEYQRAVQLDPTEPEVWASMAQMAGLEHDIPLAIHCWTKVQELAQGPGLTNPLQQALAETAAESLLELSQGNVPEFEPGVTEPAPLPGPPGALTGKALGPKPAAHPQLGRNDPCWCGSGKKYKRCHLAADRQQ